MKKTKSKKGNANSRARGKKKAIEWWVGIEKHIEEMDNMTITGYVKKIIFDGKNVSKYCVEIARETPNGNMARAWLTLTDFEGFVLEEKSIYDFKLDVVTNSYNDEFKTEFVILDAIEVETTPFEE